MISKMWLLLDQRTNPGEALDSSKCPVCCRSQVVEKFKLENRDRSYSLLG